MLPMLSRSFDSSRYGQYMAPLNIEQLPDWLDAMLKADSDVATWVQLADQVHRAEMISSPLDWSLPERVAYQAGDTRLFSRLRGYSEMEIDQFENFLAITNWLIQRYGEPTIIAAEYELQRVVSTPELEDVTLSLIARMENLNVEAQ